jgi:hypothetical protein
MGVTAAILDFDTRTPERVIASAVAADALDAIDLAEQNELNGIWEEAATQGSPRTGYVIEPDSGLSPVNPNLQILFCGGVVGPANNLVTGQVQRAGSIYVGVSVNGKLGALSSNIKDAAAGQVYTDGTDFSGWVEYNNGDSITDMQFITEASGQALIGHLKRTGSDVHHGMIAGAMGLPLDDSEAGETDKQLYFLGSSGAAAIRTDFVSVGTIRFLSGNNVTNTEGPCVGYDWGSGTWKDLDRITQAGIQYASYNHANLGPRGSLLQQELAYAWSVYSTAGNPCWGKLRQVYINAYDYHKRNLVSGTAKCFVLGSRVSSQEEAVGICNYRI